MKAYTESVYRNLYTLHLEETEMRTLVSILESLDLSSFWEEHQKLIKEVVSSLREAKEE